jgi:Asp-tRNA(Asn)/Glu-tRNA(Gln) amidotransferase A subunit family amidase
VGILGNNLEETWIVAREISSRVGGDPGAQGLSGPMTLPDIRKPRTVALLQTEGFESLSAKASAVFDSLRDRLGQLGISILTRRDHLEIEALERCIAEAGLLSRSINAWESRWPLNTYATDMSTEGLSPAMRSRLSMARAMSLEEYHALLKKREDIRSLYAQLSSKVDCCMTLSAPDVAPVGISSTGDPSFAIPGSLLGVPAISVPVFEIDGMPLGAQVLGFNKGDADAFAISAFIANDFRPE